MTSKLVITIPIEGESEEDILQKAKSIIFYADLDKYDPSLIPNKNTIQLALLRDNDRSGGNLLLPRLEGRCGSHLQGRKATLMEVLAVEE